MDKLKIIIEKNIIYIEFNNLEDSLLLLNVIYFYKSKYMLNKLILAYKKKNIWWYNDISFCINEKMLFLWIKLKDYNQFPNELDTSIYEKDILFKSKLILEFNVLTNNNYEIPNLLKREDFLKILYNEWIEN